VLLGHDWRPNGSRGLRSRRTRKKIFGQLWGLQVCDPSTESAGTLRNRVDPSASLGWSLAIIIHASEKKKEAVSRGWGDKKVRKERGGNALTISVLGLACDREKQGSKREMKRPG